MVLLYPGCTIGEVIELTTRLAEAGWGVVHVSPDGQPLPDRSGLVVHPDRSLAGTDPAEVDLVIVPGGDPAAIIDDRAVVEFLVAVERDGAVVAGICAGVLVLAGAGLLVDRSITHNYRRPFAPPEVEAFVEQFWVGALVEPDPSIGVVVDGNLVTALPNAAIEFAMTVAQQVGVLTAERAAAIGRHLRGELVAELHQGGQAGQPDQAGQH